MTCLRKQPGGSSLSLYFGKGFHIRRFSDNSCFHYGRVSHLFALKGEHLWGRFDEINNQLTVHATQESEDECLVDKTAIRTLLNGGEVFILPEGQMPGGSKLAAVMRY